jgi:hypothetical protein
MTDRFHPLKSRKCLFLGMGMEGKKGYDFGKLHTHLPSTKQCTAMGQKDFLMLLSSPSCLLQFRTGPSTQHLEILG